MNQGWIKLHRQLLEWEWYDDINVWRLFTHLLLKANHSPKKWRGILIKSGQVLTSLESLHQQTNLTIQQVRTSLAKLKSTGEITNQSTSLNRLITINNWCKYQEDNKPVNISITNEQQTDNKRVTTNKNDNNKKNVNNEKKYVSKDTIDKSNNLKKDVIIDSVLEEEVTPKESSAKEKGKSYGNEDINRMLETMKEQLGVEDFKENKAQQRIAGKNLVNLKEKLGNEEFGRRFFALGKEEFHLKNMGSLWYCYKQIKGFVPIVQQAKSLGTFIS